MELRGLFWTPVCPGRKSIWDSLPAEDAKLSDAQLAALEILFAQTNSAPVASRPLKGAAHPTRADWLTVMPAGRAGDSQNCLPGKLKASC